jgi:ADP-ribosyl-[dinitrogen reductase] hydrolase
MFSGSHDPEILDPEPLSRVVPVVMYFFADAQQAEQRAAEAARTTCQAPAVLADCRTLARALHAALAGQAREAILAAGPRGTPAGPAPAEVGTSASQALGAALEAFAGTGNFRDAVLAAANLGGNSDVVASVTGALAGAHYTASAIPALWRNSLMKQQLIEGFADRLLAHALLDLGH